jgi:hypothetical protein
MVEDLKMSERCGNVTENKGPEPVSMGRSANVIEDKDSYVKNEGTLLKTKGVDVCRWW